MRTLLVDDSPDFLAAAEALFTTMPEIEVIGRATSGEEALVQSERLAPDLVLMDVVMPRMDGFQTARLLSRGRNAPRIILASLHDTSEYRAMAIDCGAAGLVSKFNLAEELPALMRERLSS